MKKFKTKSKAITFFLIILITLSNCSIFNKKETSENKDDNEIVKKKRINPNAQERAKDARDRGLILFGKKVGENGALSFATSNIMWRASLEVLDFMPIQTLDYAGGVISTDWYKKNTQNNEEIKIRVQFLSDELSASSIKVLSHKRVCVDQTNCKISTTSAKLTKSIKDSIIKKAREIKIEDSKKNEKK